VKRDFLDRFREVTQPLNGINSCQGYQQKSYRLMKYRALVVKIALHER